MPSVRSYPSRTCSSSPQLDNFPSRYFMGDETEYSNIVFGSSWLHPAIDDLPLQ